MGALYLIDKNGNIKKNFDTYFSYIEFPSNLATDLEETRNGYTIFIKAANEEELTNKKLKVLNTVREHLLDVIRQKKIDAIKSDEYARSYERRLRRKVA